jgi:hypothetical protein
VLSTDLVPPDLVPISKASGVKTFTLAFITNSGGGGEWSQCCRVVRPRARRGVPRCTTRGRWLVLGAARSMGKRVPDDHTLECSRSPPPPDLPQNIDDKLDQCW